jgi:DNA-binding SARP family transcriptional activator/Tfp pilus assembly protein PilF
MEHLSLRLFGPGALIANGQPVRVHSTKVLALLAFLAVEENRPHTRADLASLLWGSYPEAAARQSLRQALYSLARCAGGVLHGCLHTDTERVRFVAEPGVDVDVRRFLQAVEDADPARWREAATLSRMPLLQGLQIRDCEGFDSWLNGAREQLQVHAAQNLDRLVVDRVAQADWGAALEYAQALRLQDPMREATARHLFRIFAAQGDTDAIDAEWFRLCAVLRRELGVEPTGQTRDLHRQLRRGPAADGGAGSPSPDAGATRGRSGAGPPVDAGAAEPFVRAARAAERLNAFGHACELYERALGILRRALSAPSLRTLEVLLLKEGVLERLGRRHEQVSAADEALAIAEASEDPSRIASVQLRRAGALAYLGDRIGAAQAAHRALELHRRSRDRPGEAEALRELGFLHWRAGEYPDALQFAREALALHRELADVAGEASALHNLAEIHRSLGSPRQALEWYDQAMQLHWAVGNHGGEILTVFGIGDALQQTGDPEGARRKYDAALALSERYGERTMQARALHALAMQCRTDGALDDALRYMQRAIDVDRAIHYAHALGHDLVDLSLIHQLRGEMAEARAVLQEAGVWFDITGDAAASASVAARLGELEAGRGAAVDPPAGSGRVRSHLPLPEGKVYCEFESPLAAVRRLDRARPDA